MIITKTKLWFGFFIPVFISLIACSGSPPIDTIANVEMFINQAREHDAISYAPLELKLAGEKLIEARVLMDNKHYEKARSKAEEALVDAKLAASRSRAEKAKKMAQEMQDSIDTLRREIERKYQNTNYQEESLL